MSQLVLSGKSVAHVGSSNLREFRQQNHGFLGERGDNYCRISRLTRTDRHPVFEYDNMHHVFRRSKSPTLTES